MICGAGIQFLKKLFMFYLGLLVRSMLLLWIFFFFFFSRCCTRSLPEEVVKIGCGGSPPKNDCSLSGPSLALWLALWRVTFFRRVYGGLTLLRRRLFFA
jgi:hypothetical protein